MNQWTPRDWSGGAEGAGLHGMPVRGKGIQVEGTQGLQDSEVVGAEGRGLQRTEQGDWKCVWQWGFKEGGLGMIRIGQDERQRTEGKD